MAPRAPSGSDRLLAGVGYALFAVFFVAMTVVTAIVGGLWWCGRVAYAWWSGTLADADLKRFP
ncbi:MAG: hypothetical protein RIS21_430 [Planctomycetota bacterium]